MAYTSDKEDKELLSRADDAMRLSSLRRRPCFIGFLNERERYVLENYVKRFDSYTALFYGGYENAERTVLGVSEYGVEPDDFPIDVICFTYRKVDKLSHRDFLGALMNLGIERSCIGDILVSEGKTYVCCKNDISDYIKSQIFKIGRVGVNISDEELSDMDINRNTIEVNITVSSMRLDVIVAALAGLSREKTAALIVSGKVFTNYSENTNVSHILKQDDILTIRGNGKFIIKEQSGTTKKGRLKLIVEHYR